MLKIEHLNKNYHSLTPVLSDVSLSFSPGEIVGLFGENGAGKTTLMKCILGLTPCKGSVTLDGEALSPKNIARLSFATCEHSFFPNLSANAHREFYESHFPAFRRARYDALMDFFALPGHRALKTMSTGQKNQFELVLALSQGAEYILMDEPFAGSDVFNREDFYRLLLGLLEPNETVILSTHLIAEVEHFVGRAVLLHHGKICGDTTTDALEETGETLTGFIKAACGYEPDRVLRALDRLTGENR